jgi:hypothetical protein
MSVLIVFFVMSCFPDLALSVSPGLWFVVVLGVDVGHVWSTLFETYLNREKFRLRKDLFLFTPLFCWLVGVMIFSFGAIYFWRALAYLAVFHFVRQQWGFYALYSRSSKWSFRFGKYSLYLGMIHPLMYWHTSSEREFQWFMQGDFFKHLQGLHSLTQVIAAAFVLSLVLFVVFEMRDSLKNKKWQPQLWLVLMGTCLAWHFGIVYFNNDFAFTITNVLSHGVPYFALVWLRNHNSLTKGKMRYLPRIQNASFWIFGIVFYAGVLAFFEEYLWAGFFWRDHFEVLPGASSLPELGGTPWATVLLPLLAVPQATHYVLDGFIWKKRTAL